MVSKVKFDVYLKTSNEHSPTSFSKFSSKIFVLSLKIGTKDWSIFELNVVFIIFRIGFHSTPASFRQINLNKFSVWKSGHISRKGLFTYDVLLLGESEVSLITWRNRTGGGGEGWSHTKRDVTLLKEFLYKNLYSKGSFYSKLLFTCKNRSSFIKVQYRPYLLKYHIDIIYLFTCLQNANYKMTQKLWQTSHLGW